MRSEYGEDGGGEVDETVVPGDTSADQAICGICGPDLADLETLQSCVQPTCELGRETRRVSTRPYRCKSNRRHCISVALAITTHPSPVY